MGFEDVIELVNIMDKEREKVLLKDYIDNNKNELIKQYIDINQDDFNEFCLMCFKMDGGSE